MSQAASVETNEMGKRPVGPVLASAVTFRTRKSFPVSWKGQWGTWAALPLPICIAFS
jgi:hypothetical protein